MKSNRQKKGNGIIGFTLVELLVVITIIVILAGLLLPSLRKAQQTSHKIRCANNMKQIGILFSMYTNDYRVFPSTSATWGGVTYLWQYFVSLMTDPSANKTAFVNMPLFRCISYGDYNYPYYSYSMNNYMSGRIGSTVSKPSSILLIADRNALSTDYTSLKNQVDNIGFRHLNQANLLFADGHVSSAKINNESFYGTPPNIWREFLNW